MADHAPDFSAIDAHWQARWETANAFAAEFPSEKPPYYVLDMFPYPSGAGLHVGHPLGYIATDILARYHRLRGYNVLHPMGFDAFGLPAEQYAVERGLHPAETTAQNIATFKGQLRRIGLGYAPESELVTSDPAYYRWTQWGFLQLFASWFDTARQQARSIKELEAHFAAHGTDALNAATDSETTFSAAEWAGFTEPQRAEILLHYRLAYTAEREVNWCPALGTVLANDEVIDGKSERGGHPVVRKPMRQWMLRITAYAERLLKGLETLDWPKPVVEMQRNWIGKSQGASVRFQVEHHPSLEIEVFTTRPDTLFGVTYLTLAPESPLVERLTTAEQRAAVAAYVAHTAARSEVDRMADVATVSGVFTGAYAVHPFTQEELPIWLGDYVLAGYGTGAVMGVPGHDARDWRFAKHFELPIVEVVSGGNVQLEVYDAKAGTLVNSDFLNGLEVAAAIPRVITELEKRGIGTGQTQYRLRDANLSRQRYWGAPIPIVYDDHGLPRAVPDEQLPVRLPDVPDFRPTGTGESPLAKATDWVNTPNGRRETDTMAGYACSSWYWLRYPDAHNDQAFADPTKTAYWQPVDFYLGGSEHAVGHLLYSRFWHMVLHDLGHIPNLEPFRRLVNQGMIQGTSALAYRDPKNPKRFVSVDLLSEQQLQYFTPIHLDVNLIQDGNLDVDAVRAWRPEFVDATFEVNAEGQFKVGTQVEKMSKRYHNVVNPDAICERYGADTLRLYEMFLGPLEQAKPWNTDGISGVHSFLKRLWRQCVSEDGSSLLTDDIPTPAELRILHPLLEKVKTATESLSFNTAVPAFMIALNGFREEKCHKKAVFEPFLIALSPYAPHLAEELWARCLEKEGFILNAAFPAIDEKYLASDTVEYPVQVNGKVRSKLVVAAELDKAGIEAAALADENVKRYLAEGDLKKVIVVPGRIVNLVIK